MIQYLKSQTSAIFLFCHAPIIFTMDRFLESQ